MKKLPVLLPSLLLFSASHAVANCDRDGSDSASLLSCFDECAQIEADDQRLQCYSSVADLMQGGFKGKAVVSETEVLQSRLEETQARVVEIEEQLEQAEEKIRQVEATQPEPEETFGKRNIRRQPDGFKVETTIAKVVDGANGITYLHLQNGQLWREVSDSRIRFRSGNKVAIEEGLLGSYRLELIDAGRKVKVRRID